MRSTRDPLRFISLGLALVTLLLYLPVRHYDFVRYDDPTYVSENWHVQAGLIGAGVRWAFTTWTFSNWHPLTWLSYMLDATLFGLNPGAMHVVNVLVHIVNTVLLFLLLARWTRALAPSALVAALFAWHPLHVESVAWISSRKDVLSTALGWLALWSYGQWAREKDRRQYWLAVLFLALGLMAKPMLVTWPCLLLLLDYWPLGRWIGTQPAAPAQHPAPQRAFRFLLLEKWPFFLLAAGSCAVTFLAQRAEAVVSLEALPFSLRLQNALLSYVRYVMKTFWPVKLSAIYPLPSHLPLAAVLCALAFLLLLSALLWRGRRKLPFAWVGWLWFLGTLVPVIGLIQVGGQAMADRYNYIPLVGLFVALAWSVQKWLTGPSLVVPAAALALCLLLTHFQLQHWQNSEALFRHAVAVTKDNAAAQINLGLALEEAGQLDQALLHVQEALRIDPHRPQAHNNLGNLLSAMHRPEEAIAAYRRALELKPNAALVHLNLASELAGLGRDAEALEHYNRAAQLSPDDPLPHYLLGTLRQRQGDLNAAIAQYREALRLDPNNPKALVRLARVRAIEPDARWRDGAEAVRLAERANDVTGGQEPFVLDTLAMAYAEAGAFPLAIQTAQRAQELAAALGDTQASAAIAARLDRYRAGQPYRESSTNQLWEARQQ